MQKPTTSSQQELFSCPVFSVVTEDITLDNGRSFSHITAKHPGAVVIIPLNGDGHLLLIEQYRHSVGETILEFPAGTLDPDEDPLECAKRELAEETGFGAKEWTSLGELFPAPGFCNEKQFCFFASDLFPQAAEADDDEVIELHPSSIASVEHLIASGKIKDAKSIAIYFRAKLAGHI